ncbi:MAG: hypothetical protein A2Z03_06145 [Chloroflexi bacterium RBG_16_56_8]|nr:MAG: hypothetical protein A2Z03_06145 [Chloroflexi bacterium RBG_16_56_8]
MPDYEDRKNKTFVDDPLTQFVQELRVYCQHYRSPNIQFVSTRPAGDERTRRSVIIAIDDIRAFEDWSAPARRFINELKGGANLLDLIDSYRSKIVEFYEWFQSNQERIHAEQFAPFKDLLSQHHYLLLEERVDAILSTPPGLSFREDEIFSNLFSAKEYAELERIPPESLDRPKRAIELLQPAYDVPDQLKEKIFQLYKERRHLFK